MKIAEVESVGKIPVTLFDFGAIPDVLSAFLCKSDDPFSRQTSFQIIVVEIKEELIICEVSSVPTTIASMTTEIYCVLVRSLQYQLINGRPSMKLV